MSSTSITRRSKLQRDKTISSFGQFSTEETESLPILSPGSSLPEDIITFRHSYGYNCQKPFNLYHLGAETLVFLSGNLIHFLNTRTLRITIRRSVLGTGIGCITKNSHPAYHNYLTVGENGNENPPIFIYNYPQMELQKKLVGGARRNHTRVTYSADGLLLASQSGEPDFLITVWRWQEAEIVLRLPSVAKDVYNLQFSSFTSELYTSAGAGHIQFWRMCRTFTGLKCEGRVGRFGQTEISDIYGLYQLEDGKVLSGSDWGNILVWEEGAIKYEVFRKNHKTCHRGAITQIIWQDQEVLTASRDGYVRLWFWETVDSSLPADGENFVEVEPIYEMRVGGDGDCQLMSMVKGPKGGGGGKLWYVQDGNGGIWSCEISSNGVASEGNMSRQLYKCHAGAIAGVVSSPWGKFMATLGEDGRLHLYNYERNELVFQKQFQAKGSAIIWPSLRVARAGNNLIVGLASGVIRVLVVVIKGELVVGLELIQKLKSHTRTVTQMSFNSTEEILVTGSDDHSIFVHGVRAGNSLELFAIGRVEVASIVTAISWNLMNVDSDSTVLVGCRFGEIFEFELPKVGQEYTALSYALKDLPTREMRFRSKKSEIRRLVKVKEFWYNRTFRRGEEVGGGSTWCDSLAEEKEDLHFVPPIPNKILWLRAVSRDVLWVAVAQFDAGYIYEYHFGEEENCRRVIPVPGGLNLEINSIEQVGESLLIFGLSNGAVRVTRMKADDPYDLSDYWQLGMHDNEGVITSIAFSYDRQWLFTSGADGNLFQYQWRGGVDATTSAIKSEPWVEVAPLLDDDAAAGDEAMLSSEEEKRKKNDDERHTICDAEKEKVLAVLDELRERFKSVWDQNQSLPESQRLGEGAFELDRRITEDVRATLEGKMKMAQREMEYDVERTQLAVKKLKSYFIDPLDSFPIHVMGIRSKDRVQSLKFRKLDSEFYARKKDLARRMKEFKEESKERRQSMSVEFTKQADRQPALSTTVANEEEFRVHRIESVLRDMGEERRCSNLDTKIRRLLKRYKERKAYEQERRLEWATVNQQRPNSDINHPDDVQAIEEAAGTIGDYKLKLDEDYVPPEKEGNGDSVLGKLEEILEVQERIYLTKRRYNEEIFALREKKVKMLERIKREAKMLHRIHRELPEEMRREMVEFRDFDEDLEFPEKFIGEERRVEEGKEEKDGEKVQHDDGGTIWDYIFAGETTDDDFSEVELELKARRVQEKAFEQELLLNRVTEAIAGFDEELRELAARRLSVEMDTLFLDTFLLTLQKEYAVISAFHGEEERLAALVDEKRIENGQFLSKILTQETALEGARKNLEVYKAEKKALQHTFDSNCLDNKFTDFLKWIYEKEEGEVEGDTMVVEGEYLDGDSMEERSTTVASMTSSNYDETFCPRGCDPDLYQLAFSLREARFELDRKLAEEGQVHERVKGDLEFLTREIREIQAAQKRREEDYIELRRSKQRELNAIDTVIVLHLDQLQYFKDESEFRDISKTLLFKRSDLMRLYARVGELSAETLVIKRNHRVNIVLLSRLKSDCHYMEQRMQVLRDQIKDAMVKKFGMAVDLDELQEALLTKLLFEIRLHVDDTLEGEFRQRVARGRGQVAEKKAELMRVTQEGTDKLNILTVLHEQRNSLEELLAEQLKLRKRQEEEGEGDRGRLVDFTKDNEALRMIVREQEKQLEELQREIRTLSLKCKPFSSVPTLPAIGEGNGGEGRRIRGSRSPRDFVESSYASVVNSELSSLDRQWALELRVEMEGMVGRFLGKHLQQRLVVVQMERIAGQVVEYFLQVLLTYRENRRDELLPCIIEDVLKFLPRDAAGMLKESLLVNLFDRIVRLYRKRTDIERRDIVWGIVENANEVVGDREMGNGFYIEIWRQFFNTFSVDELKDGLFFEEVKGCLDRLGTDVNRDVDKGEIIQEVKAFVLEHATEDIADGDVEGVLGAFFERI